MCKSQKTCIRTESSMLLEKGFGPILDLGITKFTGTYLTVVNNCKYPSTNWRKI